MTGLPTPSLSATIDYSRPGLGLVTVAGYTPPNRIVGDDERKPRKRIICTRCGLAGHNASNSKHHPRPL